MAEVIERIGPLKMRPRRIAPFQSLASAIIHQQLSGKAASPYWPDFRRFLVPAAFPVRLRSPAPMLKTCESAGLSRAKAAYIQGLARKTLEGIVPSLEACDSLADEELVQRLTSIKGVGGLGPLQMFLSSILAGPTCFPSTTLGSAGLSNRFQEAPSAGPGPLAPHGRSLGAVQKPPPLSTFGGPPDFQKPISANAVHLGLTS